MLGTNTSRRRPDGRHPVEIFDGPSLWGHDWVDLPDDARTMARNRRIDLASRGVQSPPFIDCPWLFEQVAKTWARMAPRSCWSRPDGETAAPTGTSPT